MVEVECPSPVTSRFDEIERRREPRFSNTGNLPITLLLQQETRSLEVELVDISRCGLGVTAGEPLPVGIRVFVKLHATGVFAVVQHCLELPEGGFRAGLGIDLMVTLAAAEDDCPQPDPAPSR